MALILIGCERSGITRDAFIKAGHDAVSCDLHPSDKPGPHLQGDVMDAIAMREWDLIILHPDCTAMAVSGNRWYAPGGKPTKARLQAQEWTAELYDFAKAMCEHVALENPRSTLAQVLGPADQTIQPWQFGHPEKKAICWWLHNLPALEPTRIMQKREEKVWKMPPSAERARLRSQWYPGIARAQARQWGDYIDGN